MDTATARARAESLMSSACTVFATGEPVTDPNTGEVTHAPATVWSGPCRVRPAGTQARETDAGGSELFTYDYLISVPFAVVSVFEKHRVTVTSSPDAALVGVTMEVQKVDRGDTITARRLSCNVVV